jgi:hypothetical protein
MMVIKRIIPKTIKELEANLQSSNVKGFAIYEANTREEFDRAKQKLNSMWSAVNQQTERVSIIAVREKKDENDGREG